jgi:hypothetical protein
VQAPVQAQVRVQARERELEQVRAPVQEQEQEQEQEQVQVQGRVQALELELEQAQGPVRELEPVPALVRAPKRVQARVAVITPHPGSCASDRGHSTSPRMTREILRIRTRKS